MPSLARRSFFKTAALGATAVTLGSALNRPVRADDVAGVKFAKDPKSLQPGLEAAHTPAIVVEKLDTKDVAYGKTPAGDFYRVSLQARHEATAAHQVFALALYLNGTLVAEHTMNPAQAEASLPVASFVQRLKAGDELLAVSRCNLHGQWGSRMTV